MLTPVILLLATTLSFNNTALSILNGAPATHSDSLAFVSYEESLRTAANLPDPQLEGEYLVAPEGETDRWGAEVSLQLEWPGIYNARKKEAARKLEAARSKMRADRYEKLTEIKSLLLDYIYLSKKLKIINELQKSNDSIYKFAQRAATAGEITVLDLNKIKLENANLRITRASIINDQGENISALTKIYGKDCSNILAQMNCEFPEIMVPENSEVKNISQNNYNVIAAIQEADARKTGKDIVHMEAFPSISVGYKHAFEDGIHFNGATVGISIPIFSSRHKKKVAKADITEAEFNAMSIEETIEAEANILIKRLSLLQEQINEMKPIIHDNDHSALLLKAYESGLISMIDYLTERNYFTNASLELLSLQHTAAKIQVSLSNLISE